MHICTSCFDGVYIQIVLIWCWMRTIRDYLCGEVGVEFDVLLPACEAGIAPRTGQTHTRHEHYNFLLFLGSVVL
jgi:hypothetical protein